MLRQGSSGDEVRGLQSWLARLGHSPGPLDGIFGPKTESAVKAFQEAAGLDVDGIAGPKTMGALEEAVKEKAEEAADDAGSRFRGITSADDDDADTDYRPGGAV
jgi:peptidoglycan hydrolase-like protein with peptidoglycan-binding domain